MSISLVKIKWKEWEKCQFVDLLSFLEMLAACLYLPCLPQTCLHFPRLVPASLPLSLPCHVFRMVFTGVSVVSRVPLLSPELLLLQSSLSSEFLVLRVPCPQSSLSLEFFRDPSQGFLLSSQSFPFVPLWLHLFVIVSQPSVFAPEFSQRLL